MADGYSLPPVWACAPERYRQVPRLGVLNVTPEPRLRGVARWGRSLMTYEIKRLQYQDLDRIYPELEMHAIGCITTDRAHWMDVMQGSPWAIDEQSGVFLSHLPGVRLDAAYRYLFGMPGGVAILRMEAYCLFAVLYLSPGLRNRMLEVQANVRDVFRAVGMLIDGTTDENDELAVPNAQLKDVDNA